MSRVDLAELDFFSPEVQECPFSVYQQLQDEAPGVANARDQCVCRDALQRHSGDHS